MSYLTEIDLWLKKNQEEILKTLSELIQIKTENLPPTGNEKRGQEYLYNKFLNWIPENDIDVFEIDDVKDIRNHPLFFHTTAGIEKNYKGRPNIVTKLKGSGEGKNIAFSGHMDTMPAKGEKWNIFKDPFSGKMKDSKIYGRGSLDMKGGIISSFYALKCINDLKFKLKGNVIFESVIDEENGGVNGTVACRLRNPNVDFAILTEPTNLIVGVETIGGSDWVVQVLEKGSGGIGSDTEISNPIYKLSKIALALEKYDKELKEKIKVPTNYQKDMRLRLLTYQISSGGTTYIESGGIPTEGHIYFWLEAYEYMKEENVRRDFISFMNQDLEQYDCFKSNLPIFKTVIRFIEGHKTNSDHKAMSSIRNAYRLIGLKCEEKGIPLAMDAFAFKRVSNTDVSVIGPIGSNLHGIDEYVEIDSIFKLIKIMVLTTIDYCT